MGQQVREMNYQVEHKKFQSNFVILQYTNNIYHTLMSNVHCSGGWWEEWNKWNGVKRGFHMFHVSCVWAPEC